jgi:hypothetical protein
MHFPYPYCPPQYKPNPYQWQSTDWQLPEFLARQNTPIQQTVTREVPPMPRPGYNPMSFQMPSGTPGMAPQMQSQPMGMQSPQTGCEPSEGRIAGKDGNICITLKIDLGGNNKEEEDYKNGYGTPYREPAPSWYQ